MSVPQTTRGSNLDYRGRDPERGATPPRAPEEDITDGIRRNKGPGVRRVRINASQEVKFVSNYIMTAKYTVWSFLPKFLFEQFRRYANIFFLCIGLLQQIPNVSPTGRFVTIVPFTVILILTALKEIVEDYKRHAADEKVNSTKVLVLDHMGNWQTKMWKEVMVGDIVKVENTKFFPADLVLLSSSEPDGMCNIETSNLDGETNLKSKNANVLTREFETQVRISELSGEVQCEPPNRNLYEFKGNVQTLEDIKPLDKDTILLRGSRLMNTAWIYGLVIYSGHETKLLMNSTKAPLKFSNIDKIKNYQIMFLFLLLVLISLLSSTLNEVQKHNGESHWYLGELASASFFYNFLTFFILYNNLIPISLQVTLEFVKFTQAYFINWDIDMYHKETDTPALARTSNINEELGQIKYVFSDKTGTLTQNVMEFKRCSIAGHKYSVGPDGSPDPKVKLDLTKADEDETIYDFLVMMAVCHTVIPEDKGADGIFYNASSPDEKALVEGAALYDFTFTHTTTDSVIIQTPRGEERYEMLEAVEFDSTRKRMSVVVRDPRGRIKLYIKGADTKIMERLGTSPEQCKYRGATERHLKVFAEEGLRTLCLGMKVIEEKDYLEWKKIYEKATTDVANKQEEMNKAAELMETNITLLGATAIEDHLQDGVPEAIAQLLEANIHVWVLTGDKQETAINIGTSCRLIKADMPLIIINANSLDEAREEITENLETFRREGLLGKDNECAVIVDGTTLDFVLDHSLRKDFLDLCCSCSSVICCRVSPIQKAQVVELVKEEKKSITLAIGDGANDVAMIQKADVGVGISGNEGLQAANSSDFAIAQFRFLTKLLFVHGAWNYSRVSKVVLYSFYKNICLYIIELWFALYNYWSGQVLFERWTIGMYNIFFTSVPPIAMGLFDQCCTAKTRMKYPSLYRSSQDSEAFNHRIFWMWIGVAILHSAFLFWVPVGIYQTGVVWAAGNTGDYLVIGNMVYTFVVITVCLKAGLEMDSWSWISHASIWGSIVFWFFFLVVYSFFWPMGLPLAANMTFMIWLIISSPVFWFMLPMVPLVTLIPDIAYKCSRATVIPTETDKIRSAEIRNADVEPFLPCSRRSQQPSASENSALLNGVRRVLSKKRNQRDAESGGTPGGSRFAEEQVEMQHGFAFSQEEGGAVSQVEYIRRYDTTKPKSRSTRGGT